MQIEHSESDLLRKVTAAETSAEEREAALLALVARYTAAGQVQKIVGAVKDWIRVTGEDQKMAVARVLKNVLDTVCEEDKSATKETELQVCQFIVQWAEQENKNFLKYKMEVRLGNVYYARGELKKARELTDKLIKDAREVDDKLLLVESHLLEAKLIYETRNWPKAKAALTASKAATNSIYIQPLLQADIDYVAGMIHMAEKDYAIAYSYFYEAFEAFNTNKMTQRAGKIFEYLILAKIMMNSSEDANSLLSGRYGVAYGEGNPATEAMRSILAAYKLKNVVQLSKAFEKYKKEIDSDKIIAAQTELLFDQLLEQNIMKVVTPYSRLEMSYLSGKLGIDPHAVEQKICQMILDGKLSGTLDQEKNELILFDAADINESYQSSLDILKNLDDVVDALFERAAKLNAQPAAPAPASTSAPAPAPAGAA